MIQYGFIRGTRGSCQLNVPAHIYSRKCLARIFFYQGDESIARQTILSLYFYCTRHRKILKTPPLFFKKKKRKEKEYYVCRKS